MMINIPSCPKCGSYTAPDLLEVNILEEGTKNTYEELYECKCGCRFVALHPRHLDDEVRVYRLEHEEKIRDLGANLVNSNKLKLEMGGKFEEQLRNFLTRY
jgi:hypothetical protein